MERNMEFTLGYPTGVPLGGIGTGMIELRSDGRIGTVGCNNNWAAPFTDTPGCFFAVRIGDGKGKEQVRLLQNGGEGILKGMDRVDFLAEYPFAKVRYACCNPVFEAGLTAFCPNIPHDHAASSTPGAEFEFALRNSERVPASFHLYLSWEHLSGCGALPDRTGYRNRSGNRIVPVSEGENRGLVFLPGKGAEALPNAVGQYALMTKRQKNVEISFHWWNVVEGQEGFLKAIEEDFPVSAPEGREGTCHPAGVLDFAISLAPGERLALPISLSWYMPAHFAGGMAGMDEEMRAKLAPMHREEEKACDAGGEHVNYGHFYENRFAGAKEAADYLLENRAWLKEKSGALFAFLQDSDLPEWLVRKLVNDDAPLSCNSILTKDGTLATLEACIGMGGALGTNDQRIIAHAAYQLFFPELNRTELRLFAKVQAQDGHIPHFCGNVHQSIGSCQVSYGDTLWPDLSCSFIFQCWRDAMCTGQTEFLIEMLPHIRRAYEWLKSADRDGDGVPEGGSTWDVEPHEGLFSYTGSIWLATLRVLDKIAETVRDAAWKAEVGEWFAKAQRSVLALFNGKYFDKLYNPVTGKGSDEIFVGQAAGEWMVRLMGLESVLPEEMVRSALKTVYENNADTSRYALAPIKVTREGKMVQRDCAEQAWPQYTMVFADCLAMYLGMEEGMKNLRHFDGIVTRLIQAPCTTTLWHNCVTGLPNWGGIDRYMNTPSVWFVLNALTGFHPALSENAITFDPNAYGFRFASVLPLVSSAFWAKIKIVCGSPGTKTVKIRFDRVFLPVWLEQLRPGGSERVLSLEWNGSRLPFGETRKNDRQIISFAKHSVSQGDEITLRIEASSEPF